MGTFTGQSMEMVDTVIRRKINFICLQETQWTDEKEKELNILQFKLWYIDKVRSRNWVRIIIDNEWNKDTIYVKRSILKVKSLEDLEELFQNIPQ